MSNHELCVNPFKIGDSEVYLDEGTELINASNGVHVLDRVECVYVAGSNQPYSYEQETIEGGTDTVRVHGEIAFWIHDYQIMNEREAPNGWEGDFYRVKVNQEIIDFHNLNSSDTKPVELLK